MGVTYNTKPLVVRDLFNPEVSATITKWLNEHSPLALWEEDKTEFVRLYGHNPPFLVNIHHQLTTYASKMFGEPVKPSYCFLSMYKSNGICPLHIDRPQCRYTIDYLAQQSQNSPWPILIGKQMSDSERAEALKLKTQGDSPSDREAVITSQEWTECLLNTNDAVLYSGTHAWHYRPKHLEGTADLIFFHFVPEDFSGELS